eukprot:2866838-Rhodomonas_salina.3
MRSANLESGAACLSLRWRVGQAEHRRLDHGMSSNRPDPSPAGAAPLFPTGACAAAGGDRGTSSDLVVDAKLTD